MAQSLLVPSFAAGELSRALDARQDLGKVHVGLRLARNVFVHPQGGVSNRPGTEFIGRAKDSANPVRLIKFQFNLVQSYALEFGHYYMRVIMAGGYVLEPAQTITAITQAAPGVLTIPGHGYANGDQLYVLSCPGMAGLASTPARQYLAANVTANSLTLTDLDGHAVSTAALSAYSGGGSIARIYTLVTPYAGSDLALLKTTQSNDTLTLTHPSHPPRDLSRSQHWLWTLSTITFTPAVQPPAGVSVTANSSGSWHFAYVVTAKTTAPAEESEASSIVTCTNAALNQNTGISNTITWNSVTGATSYAVYKATAVYNADVAQGAMLGYIGTCTGTSFTDTNISPDFTQAPPQATNPFVNGTITGVTIANAGSGYSTAPALIVSDTIGLGAKLTAAVSGGKITGVTVVNGGQGYINPKISVSSGNGSGAAISLITASDGLVDGNGVSLGTKKITGAYVVNAGQNYAGPTVAIIDSTGSGAAISLGVTNGQISSVTVQSQGSGYSSPSATITDSTAGTTAVLTPQLTTSLNNPAVATYFQQRKTYGGGTTHPQTLWTSQSSNYKNMDVSNPVRDSDAITVSIASQQVDSIRWLISLNCLLVLTSGGAWKLTAGSNSNVLTPAQTAVVPQAYSGSAEVPPLIINNCILYIQEKGASVLQLAYDFYADSFSSSEISVLSSHLFYGYQILDWAHAAQPHHLVMAVRSDGKFLLLTYLKEQDVYGFTWGDSPGNSGTDTIESVASVSEAPEDVHYCVFRRTIPGVNGGQPVRYIERVHSRNMLNTSYQPDCTKAWFVDCGQQYSGTATTTVGGLNHLEGATVSILADGYVKLPQTVTNGQITLDVAAKVITIGLPYIAQVKPLPIDAGSPTVQGKRKKISATTLRLENSRGLQIGRDSSDLEPIKFPQPPSGWTQALPLYTGDLRQVLTPIWDTEGTFLIQQSDPLPFTLLGLIPELNVGDTPG